MQHRIIFIYLVKWAAIIGCNTFTVSVINRDLAQERTNAHTKWGATLTLKGLLFTSCYQLKAERQMRKRGKTKRASTPCVKACVVFMPPAASQNNERFQKGFQRCHCLRKQLILPNGLARSLHVGALKKSLKEERINQNIENTTVPRPPRIVGWLENRTVWNVLLNKVLAESTCGGKRYSAKANPVSCKRKSVEMHPTATSRRTDTTHRTHTHTHQNNQLATV